MKPQAKAYLLTMLVILFWGTAASAFKIALRQVSPYTLLFWSVAVSTLVLLCILVLQGKLGLLRNVPAQVLRKKSAARHGQPLSLLCGSVQGL